MLILGIILIILGGVSYVHGDNLNNSFTAQFNSIFYNATANPGSTWITLGIIAAVVGLILVVYAIVKKRK